ncbi:MAG TPA: helix-hairpin-helix domain-containing protein [Candidatus Ozemobacteraceae bacterium]|nr:helix-hairpin-helix domain-containing protein [Candidatus Ozemobacteraceae bacterium]HQG27553.1 helix-hairpin-helix domain-containing protein [Candidatus Ozemobacteraceae bacterium]
MLDSHSFSVRAARTAAFLLVLIPFVTCGSPAGAWSYHTHRKIVSDALSFLPTAFQERFRPFKDLMMKGATDPDTFIKDFMNHVYHVNSRMGHDSAARIGALFNQAVQQLKERGPGPEAAYTMGLIAHYVADLNQPLHTAGSEADVAESDYHARFEKDVQSRMTHIPVPVPTGYDPVTDPERRVMEMARSASPLYGRIGAAYRSGNGVFDLDDIVNAQYAAAVKHVADFWLGVTNLGGQPIPLIPPAAIETIKAASAAQDLPPLQLSRAEGFPASKNPLIDINTATLDQLMSVPGIGEKRAQAILDARRVRPFRSIRDLANVTYPASGKKAFSVGLIDRLSGQLTAK